MIDEGNVWSDKVGMARKGKTPKVPKIDPALVPALKRAAEAATATESCAHHSPSAAPPFHCEKCGKPLSGQELVLMAVARLDDAALETLAEKTGELLTPEERRRIDAELGVDESEAGDWRNRGAFPIGQTPEEMGGQDERMRARLGLTADEAKIADGLAALAPTAVCTEPVPNEERPLECAKCGKPLPNVETFPLSVLDELADEARQSEKRFEADVEAVERDDWMKDEWRDLDPIRAGESDAAPVKMTERAADDGPSYEPTFGALKLSPLWSMRLGIMAREQGTDPATYAEVLIRRQWVARGKAG